MQLFSPWRPEMLVDWRDSDKCVKEFQDRQEIINIVRSKTFPFSMQNIIEEMKEYEAVRNCGKILPLIPYKSVKEPKDV